MLERDDDDLLGELRHGPPARPRRRGPVLLLVGVVVLAALGAGGWSGARWLRDADARAALVVSTAVVEQVTGDLAAADGARDLVAVAGTVPDAVGRLERARSRALRQAGPGPALVAAELAAQSGVLEALRPLDGMGSGPLQAWGRVRGPLEEALRAEALTRAALGRDRPSAARRFGVLDRLAPALDAAASPLLTRAATVEVDRVEDVLSAARGLGDVREAGEVARAQAPAVRRSLAVAPDDTSRDALGRCSAVITAVAGLAGLSGQDPAPWSVAQSRLADAVAWPQALAQVDGLVRRAAQVEQEYQAAVVAAGAAREADLQALDGHAASVRGFASPYAALDQSLTALLDDLVDRPADAVDLAALTADVVARQRLALGLEGLLAPPLVAPEHERLAGAAAAEAQAVQALAQALARQSGLPPLPPLLLAPDPAVLVDLPPADLVRQQVATGVERASAAVAWQEAAVRARTLVTTRPLPARPLV